MYFICPELIDRPAKGTYLFEIKISIYMYIKLQWFASGKRFCGAMKQNKN